MFRERGVLLGGAFDGTFFGRGLWDKATDVSRIGEERRGREGDKGDVGLRLELVRLWDRGLVSVFEGLRGP